MLVGVLDHDDGGVDHGTDGDGDAAEAHDVGAEAERLHRRERHQDADGQHDDRHKGAAQMQQEHDADQCDDDALLDQRPLQRLDRSLDQPGAVIDRHDLRPARQARRDLGKARLGVFDHGERIGAEALQDDAARDFALAVELGDAAPLVWAEFDPSHIDQA